MVPPEASSEPSPNWRTPSDGAVLVPFASADEVLAAAIVAATELFDPVSRDQGQRRLAALVRRIAEVGEPLPAFVRALRRWRLANDELRLLLVLVAAELSPQVLARAIAYAGDPIRPGVTVEAAAAACGDVAAVVRLLAPRGALAELSLLALRSPELPLLRRTLAPAARLVDLALGASGFDSTTGAWLVEPAASPSEPASDAARAVLRQRGTIGLVRGGRSALRALAGQLASEGQMLIACELSRLAEESRVGAVLRDALAACAALVLVVDLGGRDLARSARVLDRCASRVPLFVLGGNGEPFPPVTAPMIEIDLTRVTASEIERCVREKLGGLLGESEIKRVAELAPRDLDAVARAATVIAIRDLPLDRAGASARAIAEQLTLLDGGPLRRLPAEMPPLGESLAVGVRAVTERWAVAESPRRLRVVISGRAGAGKTTLAAAIAASVHLPAFLVEPRQLARGPDEPTIAPVLSIVARGGAVLVVENIELVPRPSSDTPFPIGWLARAPGLVCLTTFDSVTALDNVSRREYDIAISIPAPTESDRAAMWEWAASRRGFFLNPEQIGALAREFPMLPAQIERVISLATPDGLRGEAEHRKAITEGRTGREPL